jgi:hypothetical protein
LLAVIAVAEAATGLGLLAFPSCVASLLLGAELTDTGIAIGRVAGIALIALGIACLPGRALVGMLVYSALVALYLAWLGVAGKKAGVLLWPAVAVHGVLSALLARVSRRSQGCGPGRVKEG